MSNISHENSPHFIVRQICSVDLTSQSLYKVTASKILIKTQLSTIEIVCMNETIIEM